LLITEGLFLSKYLRQNPAEAHFSPKVDRSGTLCRHFEEDIMIKAYSALFLALVVAPAINLPTQAGQNKRDEPRTRQNIVNEVRHQLVLLPYYSVFDNLAFKLDGEKVVLIGQVVRPSLKSDAEAAVKGLEGVTIVDNQIEVLPLSPMDDQLRRAVYRAIYSDTALSRYGESAVPSIHIIVKNGNVTLEGIADNETDKNLANLRASGVPNVFSVKNNLVVTSGK
jgi:hyperosmotically inducible protein